MASYKSKGNANAPAKAPKKILPFETTAPVGIEERDEDEVKKIKAKIFEDIPEPTGEGLRDCKILNLTATIGQDRFVAEVNEDKSKKNEGK